MTIKGENHAGSHDCKRMFHDFILIWLDPNNNESSDAFQHSKTHLQSIIDKIEIFNDFDQCIDFITDVRDAKVLMIICETVAPDTLIFIHNIDQLYDIFIFCDKKDGDTFWIKQWWKVKGIYTQVAAICDALSTSIKKYDQNSIAMSLISIDEDISNKSFNQLDPSFMYTQLLKEIILEATYNQKSIKDFATYCRNINSADINSINKLEQEYYDREPIWWYTCESFLYPMLNGALRTLRTDTIIKIGFFIKDLHKNIERLHSEQLNSCSLSSYTVYRGQGVSEADFERLIKTNGGLLSFNNFLSTSLDRDVSFMFADSNRANPDIIGILFVINIDPSISLVPFASIKHASEFSDENEILFSMHTVFRVGEVEKLDHTNRLWQVELKLTNDDDQQLRILTDRIRMETAGGKSWLRLGILLMKIGQFNQAEEVYTTLLNQTSDKFEESAIYNQLGLIKEHQGEYDKSIAFFEKSIEISETFLPKNDSDLATRYGNLAIAYGSTGQYAKAISLFQKTLEIRQQVLPSNDPNLAVSHINLGMMYFRKAEYVTALSSYEKALKIFEATLPPNHPDFARCYNNIASAYQSLANYSNALTFHKKALDIRQNVLPSSHPDFIVSYVNIASVYEAMGNYSQALSFHEKASKLYEKVLDPDHPLLATSYNNIATIYQTVHEIPKALFYLEKALEILKKIYPSNHPSLATSYNNLATLYFETNDYYKALLTQKKAHEILELAFPIDYPMLACSYNNMASFHNHMMNYPEALLSHQKALEIRLKNLPQNHPHLASSYNNIGSVYFDMGEYKKSLPFFERALTILQQSVPSNHPDLQSVQETIAHLKKILSPM